MMNLPQSSEAVLYQDSDVSVTTARMTVGSTMYPVRGLTAVQLILVPSAQIPAKILVGIAIFFGLVALLDAIADVGRSTWVLPVILLVVAVVVSLKAKPRYAVRIWTAGGQVDAIVLKDLARSQAIITALNQAVVGAH